MSEMPKFEHIVFMQGDDADEPLEILSGRRQHGMVWPDDETIHASVEYLTQWSDGKPGEMQDEPRSGTEDDSSLVGQHRLSWNFRLHYIGLERVVDDSGATEAR